VSNTSGEVLIDGGRGQFSAEGGLSAESTAYYQRFLEGVGVTFDGINTFSATALSNASAVIVTPGPKSFSPTEIDNLRTFQANGGAVILVGSTEASDEARDTLDVLAFLLGSDLRFNGGSVTDATNNVNNDNTIPTTTAFDTSFSLFSAVDTGNSGGGGSAEGSIRVQSVNADAAGDDSSNLNDEFVVFENPDTADLDLTGYAVEDEVQKRYQFPDGFVLSGGLTVTLHSGSGPDTSTDLYWGQSSPVWNNSGDTVFVFDDTGTQVVSYSY
jgi:Intermediate filament tail domain.